MEIQTTTQCDGKKFRLLARAVHIEVEKTALTRCSEIRQTIGQTPDALALGLCLNGGGNTPTRKSADIRLLITDLPEGEKIPEIDELIKNGNLCTVGIARTTLDEEEVKELISMLLRTGPRRTRPAKHLR